MVGGELTLDMLDLSYNPISKFHEAPIQLKANGGVFLVDDFGRQRIRPQELLNRWIVPLESRVDYLTLNTGRKFQMPFDVLIVFATNLDPAVARRRGVPPPHPLQGADRGPDASSSSPASSSWTAASGTCGSIGSWSRTCSVATTRPRAADARVPPARPRRPGDRALPVPRTRTPIITRELLDAACRAYFVDEEPSRRSRSRRRPSRGGRRRAEFAAGAVDVH